MDICVSQDGEILIEMLCVHCGRTFAWKTDVARIIVGAYKADENEYFEQQMKGVQ